MKKSISLLTSFMMSVSLVGGAMTQAYVLSPSAIVSAASVNPVLNVVDTTVSFGTKKVSVPIKFTASDLTAVKIEIEVKADKKGAADPIITGLKEGVKPDVMASDSITAGTNSKGAFLWNSPDTTQTAFDDEVVAYLEVAIPDDAKEDSTYTVNVTSTYATNTDTDVDGYGFTEEDSDFSGKISFSANVLEDYITFMEKDIYSVNAGDVVPVKMFVQCPSEAIGAVIYDFALDKGIEITGYEYNSDLGEDYYNVSEKNINKLLWAKTTDMEGIVLKEETHFVTILVKVDENAKPGDEFVIKLDKSDTSTMPEEKDITPSKFAEAKLIVADETDNNAQLVIGDAEAEVDTEPVEAKVTVSIKAEDLYSLGGKFTITETADNQYTLDFADGSAAAMADGKSYELLLNEIKKGTLKVAPSENVESYTVEIISVDNVAEAKSGDTASKLSSMEEDPATILWGYDPANAGVDFDLDMPFMNITVLITPTIKQAETTTSEPVETTPAPVETTPAPVETTPAPVETTPAPVETTPAPVETTPAPVETTPAPVETTPAPVETTPAPVETTPAPVETTPAPVETTPAPVETTPAPVETTPVPVETTPAPVTTSDPIVTTPAPVTTSDPIVTTPAPVTTPIVIVIPPNDPKDPVPGQPISKFIVSDPDTVFYFSYEDKFDLKGLSLIAKCNDADNNEMEIDLTKYVSVKEGVTPASLYDENQQFDHKVPLVFNTSELDEGRYLSVDGKKVDLKDYIEAFNEGAEFYAFIGQRGDITLDHKVNPVDMSLIIDECNNQAFGDTVIADRLENKYNIPEGLLNAAGKDTAVEFAVFLGNVYQDDKLDPVDCTYISYHANSVIIEPDFDSKAYWLSIDDKIKK